MTSNMQFNPRLLPLYTSQELLTPALVYDEAAIVSILETLDAVRRKSGCRILYSVKAASCAGLLRVIARYVDGFSVSSLFEAQLAREILGGRGGIHLVSPGLDEREAAALAANCSSITCNSLGQWQRLQPLIGELSCGLRVNPELSFVQDERYDPCRPASKLGVPLSQLNKAGHGRERRLHGIRGIHMHNNCDSSSFAELEQTTRKVVEYLGDLLPELEWINLGGGYLCGSPEQLQILASLAGELRRTYGLTVYFEPGRAIVNDAGYLAASVIDVFESGAATIAVLDTTVNHMPEVFEYQIQPPLLQATANGRHAYRLAGASCLSGDLFGDYCFDEPLRVNSRIIFPQAGSYTLVKASMFNGINLPSVYLLDQDGRLQLLKQYDYAHYRARL